MLSSTDISILGDIDMFESADNGGEEWSDFEETIMPWLTMWDLIVVVVEMKEFEEKFEAIA